MQNTAIVGEVSTRLSRNDALRAIKLFCEMGHIYATCQGYARLHFYTSDLSVADFLIRRFSFRRYPHVEILDLTLSKRRLIQEFAEALLPFVPDGCPAKSKLEIALRYALTGDVTEIRAMSKEETCCEECLIKK